VSTAAVVTMIVASLVLFGGLVASIIVGVLGSRRGGDPS
jgi:hypothetical protein